MSFYCGHWLYHVHNLDSILMVLLISELANIGVMKPYFLDSGFLNTVENVSPELVPFHIIP